MEQAGISETTTKLLIGHARESITYGLYSPGSDMKKLSKAVSKASHRNLDKIIIKEENNQ